MNKINEKLNNLFKEGWFSDFRKRAAQQAKEVEVEKRRRKESGMKPLGNVSDFQRFDEENKKIRARNKAKKIAKKLASSKTEGKLWDALKKQQQGSFKAKTAKAKERYKKINSKDYKPNVIDKLTNAYFKQGSKSQQLANQMKKDRNAKLKQSIASR